MALNNIRHKIPLSANTLLIHIASRDEYIVKWYEIATILLAQRWAMPGLLIKEFPEALQATQVRRGVL
jgi:hypothetical protein